MFVFPDGPGTRDFAARFFCCCCCQANAGNITGKLKGYLLQLTKLWEELVEQTAKIMVLKQRRSQKKKLEVI